MHRWLMFLFLVSLTILSGCSAEKKPEETDSEITNNSFDGLKLETIGLQTEDQSLLWTIKSPDKALTITLKMSSQTGLAYKIDFKDRVALDWSPLGVQTSFRDTRERGREIVSDFSSMIRYVDEVNRTIEDKYTMLTGKRRLNYAKAEEFSVTIQDLETDRLLRVDLRAYNNGYAIRYVLPEQDHEFPDTDLLMHWLVRDDTSFSIGEGGLHWGQAYDFAGVWTPAYETPYLDGIASGTSLDDELGTGWGFPSLFKTQSDLWVLLHESDVRYDDQGSHLMAQAQGGIYNISPPLKDSGMGFGENYPSAPLPWEMPWRFGIISDKLNDIVESNMVFHLSRDTALTDTSWITPGVSAWSWASDHASSRNLSKLKRFIDLAATMNWPYALVDANWQTISDTSMEELVTYADAQNVGLTFWYNSGGRHNFVTEGPRNRLDDRRRRRKEFKKLQRLGVKGVKVDFFHSDKQDMMNLYLDILEDAAEYKLLVIFHGSTIPRGWARTWPNLMTMESVRGAEAYTFVSTPNYAELATYQNTIIPFTRNVIGSMDFTPVSYEDQFTPRLTTNGHETALAVLFESGIQHIADSASSILSLPDEYKKYFKTLPTVWDETRYVSGYPGKDVILARRAGERWFVAGVNGENQQKEVVLNLGFIDETILNGTILHDGEGARDFASSRMSTQTPTEIKIKMQPFGGFVIQID